MTNEAKDRAYRHLQDRSAELRRDFHEALNTLRTMADDFSEGSQQRWMLAMRECSGLRDELWDTQRQIDEADKGSENQ